MVVLTASEEPEATVEVEIGVDPFPEIEVKTEAVSVAVDVFDLVVLLAGKGGSLVDEMVVRPKVELVTDGTADEEVSLVSRFVEARAEAVELFDVVPRTEDEGVALKVDEVLVSIEADTRGVREGR